MDKNGKKGFTRRIKRSINGIKQFFMAKKNSLASNGGLFGALRSGFARMGSWFVKLKPLLRASLCIALVIVIATPIALALMPSGTSSPPTIRAERKTGLPPYSMSHPIPRR